MVASYCPFRFYSEKKKSNMTGVCKLVANVSGELCILSGRALFNSCSIVRKRFFHIQPNLKMREGKISVLTYGMLGFVVGYVDSYFTSFWYILFVVANKYR